MKQRKIQHYEFPTMDAALKAVEGLVTRGYQATIAPLDYRAGFSVSAPDRSSEPVNTSEGAAA